MWQDFSWAIEIFDKHGYPITVSIVLGYVLYKVFILWHSEVEENKRNMKRQIDELAAENRVYRLLFLRKMGLSENDLEQIFPAYQSNLSEKEK